MSKEENKANVQTIAIKASKARRPYTHTQTWILDKARVIVRDGVRC